MKTCIKIKPKDREAFMPSLQFEYSDVQQPVVIERPDCYVISYYRELGYDQFEISDPWPYGIHCDILTSCRGYYDPCHICTFDEDENVRFENVKDELPEWAYMKLFAYCHSDCHWYSCGNDEMYPDAVLYSSLEYYRHCCDMRLGGEDLSETFKKKFETCLRLLNGEQLYEHVTIEIDKKTREHDFFGMVAYLWEEDCTSEGLSDLKGTPCEHELVDIEDIFTFY